MRDYEPQSDAATRRMLASAAGMAAALSFAHGIAEVCVRASIPACGSDPTVEGGAVTGWFVLVRPSAEYSLILFRSVRTETPRRRAARVLFPCV